MLSSAGCEDCVLCEEVGGGPSHGFQAYVTDHPFHLSLTALQKEIRKPSQQLTVPLL